jgi:hypothetical protein
MLQVVQTFKRVVLDLQIELDNRSGHGLWRTHRSEGVDADVQLSQLFQAQESTRDDIGDVVSAQVQMVQVDQRQQVVVVQALKFWKRSSALVALKTNLDQIRRQVQVLQVLESFQSNCGELVDEVFGQVESLEGVSSLEDVTVESGQSVVRQFEGFQPI